MEHGAAPSAAGKTKKCGKPRTANTKVNEEELYAQLEEAAKLRASAFRWDGKDYS